MFEALCAQEMAEFDPEASDRKGYFTIARELRKTALAKAGGTEMNRLFDQMLNGITCDDCIGDGVANLPDDANPPLYNSVQLQVAFHIYFFLSLAVVCQGSVCRTRLSCPDQRFLLSGFRSGPSGKTENLGTRAGYAPGIFLAIDNNQRKEKP